MYIQCEKGNRVGRIQWNTSNGGIMYGDVLEYKVYREPGEVAWVQFIVISDNDGIKVLGREEASSIKKGNRE